ncbi:MAG: hypothetical protein AAF571_13495 [Verrucomicrobiota bacterium]
MDLRVLFTFVNLLESLAVQVLRTASTVIIARTYNCKLVEIAYAEGNSFHAKQDRQEYIFRLYHVDTPELF